jgi:photosystem II stability/assembly factor-like uncharacterized protein
MHSMTRSLALGTTVVAVLSAITELGAQARPGSAQPAFKGVFEPVSYTQDLDLTDVFFVTGEVGWVSGKHGTILRTTDGGATWEAQLGGDPEASAAPVRMLHFLDERRGWAIQGQAGTTFKTLYTSDGESWEEIGTVPHGAGHMVFTSPRTGFLAGNPSMSVSGSNIMFRTTDGGRNWEPVWECEAKVAMGGLTQNLSCVIGQIRFPTPDVGYAVANRGCTSCGSPPLIAKTTDGGSTWSIMIGPGVLEKDEVSGLFFLDEQTGFARLSSKTLHMTTDGGETWRGIVASPGEEIQFADPSVGWALEPGWSELKLSYTMDGGRKWTNREIRMPTTTRAFSFPRRDRGYVVGDHGMVFRYSVVPASHSLGPNDKAAPAMPAFDSPLDEQVQQLEEVLSELTAELSAAGTGSGGGAAGGAAADAAAMDNLPVDAPFAPPSAYMASCCGKSFSRLEVALGALNQTLPDFIGKYRNLNLLLAAVRMGAEMPSQYREVIGGLRSFRAAQDKESAEAALANVRSALGAFKQTTSVSMQQELPPPRMDP